MRITDVQAITLANPDLDPDACDSAQDAVVVLVHTDEGISGIGEVDATPSVVKSFVEAPSAHSFSYGLRDLLVGEDPLDTRRLWHKLYDGTLMAGRRGLGVHAVGAVDVALWDIRGKALGQPVWKLLGGAMQPFVVPYASILPVGAPGPEAMEDAVRRMEQVREKGFRAAKIETLREVTRHDDDVIAMAEASRETLGDEIVLMIDVGYMWRDAKTALRTISRLECLDIFFVETPLRLDAISAYAGLAVATPVRIACGELNATRFEFVELMDVGRIDVVQPDVPRCGGLTEAIRIAEAAEDRGKLVVPHAWNTGITAAAAIQLAAATPNCPYVEYLPPAMSGGLRRDLLASEPQVVDGIIPLPDTPGIGVEFDLEALEHYGTQAAV